MEREQEDAREEGRKETEGSHSKEDQETDPTHQAPVTVEPEFLRELLVMLMSWEILKYSFTQSVNKILAFDSSDPLFFNLQPYGLQLPFLHFSNMF